MPKRESKSEAGTPIPAFRRELGIRLRQVEELFPNREAAAKAAGVSKSALYSWIAGNSDASFEGLARLCNATGYSLDWLAHGRGEPKVGDSPIGVAALAEDRAVYAPEDLPDSFILLPRYEVRAAAGGGSVVHSEQIVDHLAFKRDWVVNQLRRNPANLILIEAVGDSMEPTISNRDLLLVDTSVGTFRDNAIYALSHNGGLMVKRLQRRMNGTMLVMSDNEQYGPDELAPRDAEDLVIVGQVVWHGGVL